MKLKWLGVLVACLMAQSAFAGGLDKGSIASVSTGKYQPGEKRVLALAFMTSIYSWLHRYEPELVDRDDEHVTMRVNFDYLFDVELTIKADTYEVNVSLAEKRMTKTDIPTVQKDANKIAAGIRARMEGELERSGRVK
jgi:hypothetical protein